jgi:nicotinamide-nucleotide amidase
MNEPTRDNIRARMARAGRKLNPSLERHALVLDGAAVLPNSAGLAPGELIERDGKAVFLLPGPPREFLAILDEHVVPWLSRHVDADRPAVQLFEVCGMGESDIVTLLEPVGFPPAVDVAYCARPGLVEIRLSSATAPLGSVAQMIRAKLGAHIYAEERIGIEVAVGRLLAGRKATLATAESCTGGLIGHRLTNVSGSSAYFLGGIVAYANESKVRDLGVRPEDLAEHGAVSEAVARQMAEGVRRQFESDFGLGITGIAGPTGGTADKPVGLTFIAVADAKGCVVRNRQFIGNRDVVKESSSELALDLLRRRILGLA